MQNLLTAFKILTFGTHLRRVRITPEQVGAVALDFPLVGLALGFILNILNRGMEPYLASAILAVVIVAILAVLTTATHLDALQKTFDILQANPDSTGRVFAPVGIKGTLATLFVVLLKVHSVEVIGESLGLSLLLTPMLPVGGVVFMYGSTTALDNGASVIVTHVKTWHTLVTSVAPLGFAYVLAGRIALWIGLCVSLLALLGRRYLCRRHGDITVENFGDLLEISEALGFLFFASI